MACRKTHSQVFAEFTESLIFFLSSNVGFYTSYYLLCRLASRMGKSIMISSGVSSIRSPQQLMMTRTSRCTSKTPSSYYKALRRSMSTLEVVVDVKAFLPMTATFKIFIAISTMEALSLGMHHSGLWKPQWTGRRRFVPI